MSIHLWMLASSKYIKEHYIKCPFSCLPGGRPEVPLSKGSGWRTLHRLPVCHSSQHVGMQGLPRWSSFSGWLQLSTALCGIYYIQWACITACLPLCSRLLMLPQGLGLSLPVLLLTLHTAGGRHSAELAAEMFNGLMNLTQYVFMISCIECTHLSSVLCPVSVCCSFMMNRYQLYQLAVVVHCTWLAVLPMYSVIGDTNAVNNSSPV